MSMNEQERAWRQLYEEHFDALYRLVVRLGVEGAERDDLVQRAFELAFVRVSQGMPLTDVGRWLRGTIGRLVRSHRRWKRVRTFHASAIEVLFALMEPPPTPQATMAQSQ